jgi:non-specific protein-tyrosine kinase
MELRRYWAVIWRHLWLILLTTAVATGAAYYFSANAPIVYEAKTTLEVSQKSASPSAPFSDSNARTTESAVDVFSAKIQSPVFLEKVKRRLEIEMDLEGKFGVNQVGNSQFLRISVQTNDPGLSRALVDTAAKVFIEEETSQQQARFQREINNLQDKIEDLENSIAETRAEIASLGSSEGANSQFDRMERSRLESALSRDQTRLVVLLESAEEFRMAMVRYTDYISVYAPAEVSEIGTSVLQKTLLGGATGLMIGGTLAFLLEYLDDTIRTPEDVKRSLPVGVLSALPRLQRANGQVSLAVVEDSFHPVAEAFRNLRTSIRFSAVDEPVQTLLVTSPLPTEGKTFTAANLGAVMAQGGQRVIVVDADLRRPLQHRVFQLPKEPGLTSVMLSEEEESTVLQKTDVEGLQVVTGGPQAPNPAELVASQRFRAFVSRLKEQADTVIFDSPPTLAVSDAAVLSTLVDSTLLVVDHGQTRRPAAVQAVERLMNVGGNVLGVVLNRVPSGGDGYYYYNYYYYSDGRNGKKINDRFSWLSDLLPWRRRHASKSRTEPEARARKGKR